MDILGQLILLRGRELERFLRQDSTKLALAKADTDEAIAWLEQQMPSSVERVWGVAVHSLHPDWTQLEEWFQLSKLHCLAAVDALKEFAKENRLPVGADARSVNDALDRVLSDFGNPRLANAAEFIRNVCSDGRPKPTVAVPKGFARLVGHLEDARGRSVTQCDPIKPYRISPRAGIPSDALRSIVDELQPEDGMQRIVYSLRIWVPISIVVVGVVVGIAMITEQTGWIAYTVAAALTVLLLSEPAYLHRSRAARYIERVAPVMLAHRRCPHCAGDLGGLRPDSKDGATVCSGCGCAWLLL